MPEPTIMPDSVEQAEGDRPQAARDAFAAGRPAGAWRASEAPFAPRWHWRLRLAQWWRDAAHGPPRLILVGVAVCVFALIAGLVPLWLVSGGPTRQPIATWKPPTRGLTAIPAALKAARITATVVPTVAGTATAGPLPVAASRPTASSTPVFSPDPTKPPAGGLPVEQETSAAASLEASQQHPTATSPASPSPAPTASPTTAPTVNPTPTAASRPAVSPGPVARLPAATPKPSPAPSPASAGVPALLSPEDGSTRSGVVQFQWKPAGPLPAGAAYEVVWWNSGEVPAGARGIGPTTTGLTLSANIDVLYDAHQMTSSSLYWTVLVVQTAPYVRLTDPNQSARRLLIYGSRASGGGGSQPPPKPR